MDSKAEALELYQTMVATVTANEQRRQQISSVFVTLLAAGFGAAGAIKDFNLAYATAPALLVSLVWIAQVRFLKQLATAKFHVIGELEKKFDYQPFAEEWRFLGRDDPQKSWHQVSLSAIEMVAPVCVFIGSASHLLWLAWSAAGST